MSGAYTHHVMIIFSKFSALLLPAICWEVFIERIEYTDYLSRNLWHVKYRNLWEFMFILWH